MMADSPVIESGLFTVHQTSFPEEQLEQYLTFRVGKVLNMVSPPVLFSFGLPGNLMTLLVLTRSAFSSNACCKYLAALALCDILVLVLYFCFSFVDTFLYKLLSNDVSCKLYYFLFFTSAHLSAWLLVAVTTQRCFVVCRPMTSRIVTSQRCTVCVIGGLTVASATLNFHQLVIREIVWSETTNNSVCHVQGATREVFVREVWPWLDATAYCFLPSLSLFILNVLIVRALRRAAVFRKSLQCHRQNRQAKRVRSTENRVKAEENEDLSAQSSANSLFVCEVGEATSRLSRSVIAPRTDDPISPAWNINSSTPTSGNEGSSSHCDCNHPQVQNEVTDKETRTATNCVPTTRKDLVKGSDSDVRNDCDVYQTDASSQLSASECLRPESESDSVEIGYKGTLPIDQPINGCTRSLDGKKTPGLLCNKETNRSPRTQTRDNSNSTVTPVHVSRVFSHTPEENGNRVSDKNDQTSKPEHRNLILSLCYRKKEKYDLKDRSFKLSRLSPRTDNVVGLSLNTPTNFQTHTVRVSERGSKVNQSHERESHSRQLTMMPLMASLVFLTLSAPLAVMLVAENTIWIRNSAEQVAVYTLVRMVANTLMFLNHSVNFLLYCFAGTTFRRHCCTLLFKACPCSSKFSARLVSCPGTKSNTSAN